VPKTENETLPLSDAWRQADKPAWLNEEIYRAKIQPRLSGITIPVLMSALNVSKPYAADIRAGRRQDTCADGASYTQTPEAQHS
jgi:hypothetical protein